jgi:hypothetical protein
MKTKVVRNVGHYTEAAEAYQRPSARAVVAIIGTKRDRFPVVLCKNRRWHKITKQLRITVKKQSRSMRACLLKFRRFEE